MRGDERVREAVREIGGRPEDVETVAALLEPRLHAASGDPVASPPDVQWAFERLLPLGTPFLLSLHRRLFERELAEVGVRAAEARAGPRMLPGAVERRDPVLRPQGLHRLRGHPGRRGGGRGDRAVLPHRGCGGSGDGRVVKGLGDGYMLAFTDATDAVATGWRVIARRHEEPGPGVHASVHQGVAVARDGDYFGAVVNVAARLLAEPSADELVATHAVAAATASQFAWDEAGASHVRGVGQPVDVCRLLGPRGGEGSPRG